MPNTERRHRSLAVLRTLGLTVALIFGAVAIWLIVTSTTQPKRIEIGVLVGLWGLLLGAYSMFGSRSRVPAPVAPPSQELDLRKIGELERVAVVNAVAAARREFQAELEEMLRREVQAGVAEELAGLRAEVTALRNELVEKVGGQLRLERIETTRLIGSDLEALQHELRQLREIGGREQDSDLGDAGSSRVTDVHDAEIIVERLLPVPQSAPQQPAPQQAAPQQAAAQPVAEPVVVPAEPEAVAEPEAAPLTAAEEEPEPEPVTAAEPEPEPEPEHEQPVAAAKPERDADPFASMPRIRPFTDFELDPTPPTTTNGDVAPRTPGRHSTGDDDVAARSGRRHRADDDANDVLARILARETRS